MSRPSTHLTLSLVAVTLATAVLVAAAREQVRRESTDVFRTGIDLVQMSATVVDADGRLVGDLQLEDFEVFEDGERQTVTPLHARPSAAQRGDRA